MGNACVIKSGQGQYGRILTRKESIKYGCDVCSNCVIGYISETNHNIRKQCKYEKCIYLEQLKGFSCYDEYYNEIYKNAIYEQQELDSYIDKIAKEGELHL